MPARVDVQEAQQAQSFNLVVFVPQCEQKAGCSEGEQALAGLEDRYATQSQVLDYKALSLVHAVSADVHRDSDDSVPLPKSQDIYKQADLLIVKESARQSINR